MTEQQERMALYREAAWGVAKELKAELKEYIASEIKLHAAQCPVKAAVEAKINQGRGAAKVIAVIAAGVGGCAAAVVNHFWK